jgi:hypothetical protein
MRIDVIELGGLCRRPNYPELVRDATVTPVRLRASSGLRPSPIRMGNKGSGLTVAGIRPAASAAPIGVPAGTAVTVTSLNRRKANLLCTSLHTLRHPEHNHEAWTSERTLFPAWTPTSELIALLANHVPAYGLTARYCGT